MKIQLPPSPKRASDRCYRFPTAFTLVEMLVVISIMALMMAVARPAVEALSGAGSVNRAAADLSGLVSQARAYALSNNTYVRLAIHEAPSSSTSGSRAGTLYVIPFYAVDGVKDGDMADVREWRQLGEPLVLQNLRCTDALASTQVDLSLDFWPAADPPNGRGTDIQPVQREIPAISDLPVTLASFVQFSPLGEVSVRSNELVRHVSMGFNRPSDAGQPGRNPFIVRITGATGSIQVLRKEDM